MFIYLQRESLVSGLTLLIPTPSQRANQRFQGGAKTFSARGVQAASVSKALRMCV